MLAVPRYNAYVYAMQVLRVLLVMCASSGALDLGVILNGLSLLLLLPISGQWDDLM